MIAWGFHYSIGGNKDGSGAFIEKLNAAGIPIMMKGANDAGLCFEAQEKGKQYGVENILIWRATSAKEDTPDYWLAPSEAASKKWGEIKNLWPPELDKSLVWWEVINEPRKQDGENEEQPTWGNMHTTAWLGLFMVEMAKLMVPAGHKLCGPSFSNGEPEPADWQLEGMATWLQYCADNPTKAAISHHEYNYGNVPFANNYPWHYGRFQSIIAAADKLNIPRTFQIFLTEFGWTYQTVPLFETAVPTLTEYAKLGAKFPQLKGIALWTLQSGWGGISDQLAAWISNAGNPFTNWIINNQYPELPQPQPTADEFGATLPNEEPPMKHKAIVVKLPQDMTATEWNEAAAEAFQFRHTMTASHDDMLTILNGGNDDSYVKFSHPGRDADAVALVEAAGYSWQPLYDDTPPPPAQIDLKYRPCQTSVITQLFGANPDNYPLTPGHEGIDYAVAKDGAFYAAAAGIVVHASNLRWSSNTLSDYGWHVVLNHGDYCTVYAHARSDLPVAVGQSVVAGQVVGYSGNTGNSTGYHLHFTLLDKTGTIDPTNGYPNWKYGRPVNPLPFVTGKPAPPLPQPTIDLLGWIRGNHRMQFDKEYKLANGVTGTQTTQVFHLNNGNDWLYIKGEQGHYEHLGLRTYQGEEWIFRFEDTSEAWDRWYAHFLSQGGAIGAPWLPRFIEVGKWYETPKWVQHYGKDSTGKPLCNQLNNGNVVDKLRVISEPYSRTYQSGKTIQVLTVEWASGEQYDFAGGNIAFRNTAGDNFWFMQWLEGRADKTYKKVDCLSVGW